MNYKLKENSERIYSLNTQTVDGKKVEVESGYIAQLENGNYLVYCGGNQGFEFDEKLFNLVKNGGFGKVINNEHSKSETWDGKERTEYFYEVETLKDIQVIERTKKVFDKEVTQKIINL